MRTITAVLGLALAAAGAGCAKDNEKNKTESTAQATEQLPTMTVDDVDKALAANEVTAVDCNGDRTRKKLGVVPGAILLSDEEEFGASELPADKTRKLVFYCADPG
jgi:hypothetical protein